MIERKFVAEKIKEFQIEEFIKERLADAGLSSIHLQKTALGERIIVHASRPGLVVGKKGENIKKLTKTLKKKFGLDNPQIELAEVSQPNLDAQIIADRMSQSLVRFGPQRFKGIGHQAMEGAMQAGALGIEIILSGKIPSARAKSWRFYKGYLKKSGDVAVSQVRTAYAAAELKAGTIGIKVSLMPPDVQLPDKATLIENADQPAAQTEVKTEEKKEASEEKPKKKRAPRKKKTEGSQETKPETPKETASSKEATKEEAITP